jgi:hypothetical protein
MTFTSEELMAYADGALDAERRRALDAAIASDAALRARVEALRAQRERVESAYASVIGEPVPARLRALLDDAPKASAVVVDLAAARAHNAERPPARAWGWMQWGGMAASVLLGLLIGLQFAPRGDGGVLVAERGGRLVAGATLARALDTQLASHAQGAVTVQLSFIDKSGRYCRTFSSAGVAGLACRDATAWALLVAAPAPAQTPMAMRQAATALPRAVLDAVDQRIDGNALNAAQERDAREHDWKR